MNGKNNIKKIFAVVSAYNEEKRIGNVVKDLVKQNITVVVVDDGSTDRTSQIALKNKATVLTHKINLGKSKGAAMKTGAVYSFSVGADAVVFLDGDGQHSPQDFSKFIDSLKKGYDIVFGVRKITKDVPLVRYLGYKFAPIMIGLLFGKKTNDVLCGYRAITRFGFNKIIWESVGYSVETEMVIRAIKKRLKYCEVPVQTIYFDKMKGVSVFDAVNVLGEVLAWRIKI